MFRYGKTLEERKKNFKHIILQIKKDFGTESLNDNTMNPKGNGFNVVIPKKVPNPTKTKYLKSKNIYARGRDYFGNWKKAVEYCGINYDESVLRRVSSHSIEKVLLDFIDFDKQHKQSWIITDLRKNQSLERAIQNTFTNKNRSFPFAKFSEEKVFVAWMSMKYYSEFKKIEEDKKWWDKNFKSKKEYFNENHRGQKNWGDDNTEIIKGIQKIYATGTRLTREEINKSKKKEHKTVWSAVRQTRFREKGKFENEWLRESGFIQENLYKLYREIDKPFSLRETSKMFEKLMGESIANNQNRLTREYCQENHPEFTNFLINEYNSWDSALRKHGLDPAFFRISQSKRAKRGLNFQDYVNEMFISYGLKNDYVYDKKIPDCKHTPYCKPDFRFKNFIIDTKTGFNASRQPDQLKRYLSHTDRLIILTLKGKSGVERIGKRKIEKINFKDFIKCSKELLGVKLDSAEEQNLSLALKRKPFWL